MADHLSPLPPDAQPPDELLAEALPNASVAVTLVADYQRGDDGRWIALIDYPDPALPEVIDDYSLAAGEDFEDCHEQVNELIRDLVARTDRPCTVTHTLDGDPAAFLGRLLQGPTG